MSTAPTMPPDVSSHIRRNKRSRTAPSIAAVNEDQFHEITRCAQSAIHFIMAYCLITHPRYGGKMPFKLYKYQRQTIHYFLTHAYNVILKSRQMGMTWVVAAYVLWLCMFHSDKNVLFISIKEGAAKRIIDRIKYMYDHLPEWLRIPMADDTKTVISFTNGSRVESVPTSENAGRSEAVTLLVLDEAAHIRWIDEIWTAAEPTLSTGGMCIILSTPNGVGNLFHKIWSDAVAGQNSGDIDFYPIHLPWWKNPVFGEGRKKRKMLDVRGRKRRRWWSPWYEKRRRKIGPMRAAQEIDCEFLSTGANFFDLYVVQARMEKARETVEFKMRMGGELRVYEKAAPGKHYVAGIDTATGHGEDYSCVSIREFVTWRQVATYRTQLPISVFSDRVYQICEMYNFPFVVGEENGVSIAVLLQLRDRHNYPEERMYHDIDVRSDQDERDPGEILGWNSNKRSKTVYLRQYEALVRQSPATFNDLQLLNELQTVIVHKSGKIAAMDNYTDDAVFADLCCFIGLQNYQPYGDLPFVVQ